MKIKRVVITKEQRQTLVESAGADSGLTLEAVNQIADFIETSMNSKLKEALVTIRSEANKEFATKWRNAAKRKVRENKRALMRKVDMYLDYVVTEWYKKNRPVIESGINTVRDKRIVEQMLQVFEQNYVSVPESKVDTLKEVGNYAVKMERIAKLARQRIKANEQTISALKRRVMVESASRNLTETQREKLKALATGLRAKSVDEFKTKLKDLRRTVTESQARGGSVMDMITEGSQVTQARSSKDSVQDAIARASAIL